MTEEQKHLDYLQRLREYRDTLKMERQKLVGISESESLRGSISAQQKIELYDSAIRGLEGLFPELKIKEI